MLPNSTINSRYRLERCCSRSQFYHGLSSEIKDALVHFDNPSSVSAAMDMAIRIDNRLFERRQGQRFSHQRPSSSYSSATSTISRFRNQQQQQQDYLIPDNLQLQIDPTLLSTYLLLGLRRNQTITWTLTLFEGPIVFHGARTSSKTRTLPCLWQNWTSKGNLPKVQVKFELFKKHPRYSNGIHKTARL
ncbi:hypothetical protein BASA60_005680 [Batrachochytrium salamandrivorans]|nr:hypothetical protein BASA60_005680 [Batrachochytrium salamandrivorans]